MGARKRLNIIAFYTSLILAAIIGGACQSWTVFYVVAGVLIVGSLYAGDIRVKGSQSFTNRRG